MGLPKTVLSEQEYLDFERESLDRHQYVDGEIFAMAGESDAHGDITINLVVSLGSQLRDSPCRLRDKDTKVRSGPLPASRKRPSGLFSYPDVVVICGEPKYLDEFKDVILNPAAIVEVLSESTEGFDRGVKFHRYQRYNPTLTDYVLVSQDRPQVDHYHRQKDGTWTLRIHEGLKAVVKIASIKCQLKLIDVYHRVVFKMGDDE